MIGSFVIQAMLFTTAASGLMVKVLAVDPERLTIFVLLPMHNTRIECRLAADEPRFHLEPGKFYRAKVVSGQVDTIRRNWIQIETDDGDKVRFRLRRIQFLD